MVLLERSSEYNDPPVFSEEFSPSQGQSSVGVDLVLTWAASDPNEEDSIRYDVVSYESNNEESWVFEDLDDDSLWVEGLKFNTLYFWQVTASDPYSSIQSELLSFRTMPLPDNHFLFTRKTEADSYEIFS